MARLLSTIIDGFNSSKDFVSGALGTGWRIAKQFGRWVLEIDDIVVRGRMTVFELLIQKIRAVKGALSITQGSGKIKEIREDDTNYYIQVEDEMSFVANDIIRCQTFSSGVKNYWVIVWKVENNEVVIPKSEFLGYSLPEVGDEMIQFGNTTDITRQSAIYLHADEGGQPAIDVLFGINSKSFDGKTKIRLGGDIPGELGKKGFYCENGLIKSVNTDGEVMYMLRPDGSGVMAKGNISWDADGNGSIFNKAIYWDVNGFHFGSGIKLTWDNLDDTVKDNLKGDPGESPVRLDLTNENATVTCDTSGNVIGIIPGSKASVYTGSTLAAGWSFSGVFSGCQGTVNALTGDITVSGLTADNATVTVKAVKDGYAGLETVYTLSKVYPGADGDPARSYWLVPSVNVVKKSKTGVLTPSSVSCAKLMQVGGDPVQVTTGKTLKYRLSNGSETSYAGAVSVGSAEWLDFLLYDGSVLLDRERIPVVADGRDGSDGASSIRLDLTNENASVACDASGSVVGTIPGSVARVFAGGAVDSGWSFSGVVDGCRANVGSTTGLVSVLEIMADNATVTVQANKNGYTRLEAVYTLSKVYPGSDGEAAVVYSVRPSVDAVVRRGDGSLNPGLVSCEKLKQSGSGLPVVATGKTLRYRLSPGSVVGVIRGSTATVHAGTAADTGWRFSGVFSGCQGTVNPSTGVIKVTRLLSDSGTVTVTARKGTRSLEAVYALSKSYPGPGDEVARSYWLVPSVDVIKKSETGVLTPSSVGCAMMMQAGGGEVVSTTGKTLRYRLSNGSETSYAGAVSVGSAEWLDFLLYDGSVLIDRERIPVLTGDQTGYLNLTNERATVNCDSGTERDYAWAVDVNGAEWVEFSLYDGSVVLDRERVPVLTDGQDGQDGSDANLLPWVEEWSGNSTEIGGEHVVSPKMFSGTKDETTGKLTGVAFGRGVVEIDGVKKTGVFGLKDGVITFSIDEDGNASFKGRVESDTGKIGPFYISGTTLQTTYYRGVDSYEMKLSAGNFSMIRSPGADGQGVIIGPGAYWGDASIYLENTNMEHRSGVFNTAAVHFRQACTQARDGGKCPVVLPLYAGETWIGNVGTDTLTTITFPELNTSNYVVIGSFRASANGDSGVKNNGITWVVTERGGNFFKISTWDRSGDTNSLVFCYALFPL